jgi:hypothetical protein
VLYRSVFPNRGYIRVSAYEYFPLSTPQKASFARRVASISLSDRAKDLNLRGNFCG